MEERTYILVDKLLRERTSLKPYESIIKYAYERYSDDIEVNVFNDYYCVYGELNNTELRQAGRYIATHCELGRYCKHHGNSTQLFKCVN